MRGHGVMTDLLLTHGYFLSEDEKEQQIMKPYPPLGLLYLSAYLACAGYRPEIWVSDLYTAQRGPADTWQVCLAQPLRDLRASQPFDLLASSIGPHVDLGPQLSIHLDGNGQPIADRHGWIKDRPRLLRNARLVT